MPARLVRFIVRQVVSGKRPGSKELEPEAQIMKHEIEFYHQTISKHIPYFNLLTPDLQHRFIQRTYYFLHSKQFYYDGIEPTAEMPVLVSAAAVKITFGLRRYKLSFFKNIYIRPDAYNIENMQGLYIGHVAPRSIHISWKHFLHGYADQSDNVNVAIHEMAHALHYEHFLPQPDIDWEFRQAFEQFQRVTGPAFAAVLRGKPTYLRAYAYTNPQEFWAVCVEAFFENPDAFKKYMPGHFEMVGRVVKQS